MEKRSSLCRWALLSLHGAGRHRIILRLRGFQRVVDTYPLTAMPDGPERPVLLARSDNPSYERPPRLEARRYALVACDFRWTVGERDAQYSRQRRVNKLRLLISPTD